MLMCWRALLWQNKVPMCQGLLLQDAVTYDDFDLLRSECIDSKQRGPQNLFVTGTVQQEGDHFIKATNAIVSTNVSDDEEYLIGPRTYVLCKT